MRRLLVYMRPYWKMVTVSLVFLLIQSGLQVLGPLITKVAVDKYLSPSARSIPTFLDPLLPADAWAGLGKLALLYLVVIAGTFVSEFVQMYLMQYTGQLAMFDLRRQLMEHLQRLDLAFYDRNPVGRLVTRVTTDVDVLNDLFASGLVTILGDVLVLALHPGGDVPDEPDAHRHHAGGHAASSSLVTIDFPAQRDAELPAHPGGHRPNQLLSAGAHHGHRGAAAIQSRAAQRARNSMK